MADSKFNKNDLVFFNELLAAFGPNNITAMRVAKYKPKATEFERAGLETWRPLEYNGVVKEGLTLAEADFKGLTQMAVPSTLNANAASPSDIKNVPWKLNAVELNDRVQLTNKAKGASRALAALVDSLIATEIAFKGSLFIGESTPITNYTQAAKCEEVMSIRDISLADPRTIIMNPIDYNAISGNLANRNAVPTGVSLKAFKRSEIPMIATFDSFKTNFMPNLKATTAVGSFLTNAATAQKHVPRATDATTGNNVDNRTMVLAVDSGTTAPSAGDAFTIADVNAMSQIHKKDTGVLQTFRIISATLTSWVITPAIITNITGTSDAEKEYPNCTNAAENNKAIVFKNIANANTNIFFHNEAVEIVHGSLATMDLSEGGVPTMVGKTDSGIEILMAKESSINALETKYRFTMWVRANVLRNEMCGVLVGNQQ